MKFFLFLIIVLPLSVSALEDSLRTDDKVSIGTFILPLSLITAGAAISGSDLEKDIQSDIQNFVGNDFDCEADDYIVHVPAAEVFFFDLIGYKAKNNFFQRAKYFAIANLASQGLVQSLKYSTNKLRPNGENRESFPSSHTNIAFTNATVLYHEYKDTSSFIAYSGYVFAVSTGALRIMNNNHWTGDVLAGAGIGIFCANLVYQFEPLKDWHPFGLGKNNNIYAFPEFGNDSYGLSLMIDL